MRTINSHEAKTHLSRLLDEAVAGEEIIISRSGVPIAKLIGYQQPTAPRTGGQWRGKVRIGDDFDDTLPDAFMDAFSGKKS